MTPNSDPTVQPVPASVVRQVDAADSTLSNPQHAVIALGSNLGDRLERLQSAIDALADTPGLRVGRGLARVRDLAVGVEPGSQPAYYNAVVLVRTTLPPSSLLERGHAIEEALERVREESWGAAHDRRGHRRRTRTCTRTIRCSRCRTRGCTSGPSCSAPWHDVDPSAEVPGRGPVADLLASVGRGGVEPREDLELSLPD